MPFIVPIEKARRLHPEYTFVAALTPSEQKAAFHVRDGEGNNLCLKMIAPDYDLDRLNREIHALQKLNHQNVARLREYTLSSTPNSQRHYLVEEFIVGEDLARQIDGPWKRTEAAHCFAQIANGLDALRMSNIVHRDLKPTNIRIRIDNSPVIIDFGLARHLDLPDLTKTEEGAGIGTPMYFAPEQFTGNKRDIDHRTDLFAVGVMLYQALVGKHPFYAAGMTRVQLADAVCASDKHERDVRFKALPSEWQLIACRLLQKQRVDRTATGGQLSKLLGRVREI